MLHQTMTFCSLGSNDVLLDALVVHNIRSVLILLPMLQDPTESHLIIETIST